MYNGDKFQELSSRGFRKRDTKAKIVNMDRERGLVPASIICCLCKS